MPLLINREVVADNWSLLNEEAITSEASIRPGNIIVPLTLYQEHKALFTEHNGQVALQVNGDDDLTELMENFDQFPMIAIEFPIFRDGRGFSIARLLVRAGYQGEIRATGDIGRDRLAYMERCGFTAIQVADDQFKPEMLNAFDDISNYYQSATDNNRAVYHQ